MNLKVLLSRILQSHFKQIISGHNRILFGNFMDLKQQLLFFSSSCYLLLDNSQQHISKRELRIKKKSSCIRFSASALYASNGI
ncbi:CLUMA_CG002733, isoform A [Clunio marinus]|uniref:CLUMA_CG002733, isoform A n=1 Tax=Clunio marinus TaxID=568069 RepID=A0A1J1HMY4_9DIPT|nr:CLUMA_CG002733, isoform A [Clunio marinus]